MVLRIRYKDIIECEKGKKTNDYFFYFIFIIEFPLENSLYKIRSEEKSGEKGVSMAKSVRCKGG